MMHDNKQFAEFREALALHKVRIHWAWQARRDGKPAKYPKQCANVGMLMFTGEGFQPKHLTAIVIDYGPRDGFALYLDANSTTIAADAETIAGPDWNAVTT